MKAESAKKGKNLGVKSVAPRDGFTDEKESVTKLQKIPGPKFEEEEEEIENPFECLNCGS